MRSNSRSDWQITIADRIKAKYMGIVYDRSKEICAPEMHEAIAVKLWDTIPVHPSAVFNMLSLKNDS